MVLDNAVVELTTGGIINGKVLFKDGGYIGVNNGDGWVYHPPHRVKRIESTAEQ